MPAARSPWPIAPICWRSGGSSAKAKPTCSHAIVRWRAPTWDCDCWLRFSLSVVPAKAGTHNHRTLEYGFPRARGRPNGQSDRELARDWQKLSGDVQSETTEECCGRRRAMKVFMFHL